MGLGDATCGSTCGMLISGSELENITAANLIIGDSTVGDIFVDNITAANSNKISGITTLNASKSTSAVTFLTNSSTFNALTVNSGQEIAVNALLTTDTAGLTLNAGAAITQSAALSVAGTSSFQVTGTDALTLTNTSNDFTGAVELSSGTGAVQLTDANALTLAASSLGGTLTIAGGTITQTGALSVTGTSSFTVTGTDTLTLTNTSNAFTGAVTLSSGTGKAAVIASGAASLAASTLGGELDFFANDGLTISGNVTTAGSTNLNGNNNSDTTGDFIVSDGATVSTTNNALLITGKDFNLNTTGALNSGSATTSIAPGAGKTVGLGATAGDMTISGAELQNITAANLNIGDTVNKNTGAITVNGITLANTANISGTLTLESAGAVNFNTGATAITNSLSVKAGGTVAQTAALAVGGTSGFTATGTDTITLTNAANDFTGAVTLSAGSGAVQLTDANAFTLGRTDVGGDMTLTTSGLASVNDFVNLTNGTLNITVGNDSSMFIAGHITASGGIVLKADDDITFGAGSGLTSTTGNISLTADNDNDNNGSGGAITMNAGFIRPGTGSISLTSDEDITPSTLITSNTTSTAVVLTSKNGGVKDLDTNGTLDIGVANGTLVATTATNFGTTANPIEVTSGAINSTGVQGTFVINDPAGNSKPPKEQVLPGTGKTVGEEATERTVNTTADIEKNFGAPPPGNSPGVGKTVSQSVGNTNPGAGRFVVDVFSESFNNLVEVDIPGAGGLGSVWGGSSKVSSAPTFAIQQKVRKILQPR